MGFNIRVEVTPPTENVKVEVWGYEIKWATNYTDPNGSLVLNLESSSYPIFATIFLPDYGLESDVIEIHDLGNYEVDFDLAAEPKVERIRVMPLAGIAAAAGVFFIKVFKKKK